MLSFELVRRYELKVWVTEKRPLSLLIAVPTSY
jgi:hypothetical protein